VSGPRQVPASASRRAVRLTRAPAAARAASPPTASDSIAPHTNGPTFVHRVAIEHSRRPRNGHLRACAEGMTPVRAARCDSENRSHGVHPKLSSEQFVTIRGPLVVQRIHRTGPIARRYQYAALPRSPSFRCRYAWTHEPLASSTSCATLCAFSNRHARRARAPRGQVTRLAPSHQTACLELLECHWTDYRSPAPGAVRGRDPLAGDCNCARPARNRAARARTARADEKIGKERPTRHLLEQRIGYMSSEAHDQNTSFDVRALKLIVRTARWIFGPTSRSSERHSSFQRLDDAGTESAASVHAPALARERASSLTRRGKC